MFNPKHDIFLFILVEKSLVFYFYYSIRIRFTIIDYGMFFIIFLMQFLSELNIVPALNGILFFKEVMYAV